MSGDNLDDWVDIALEHIARSGDERPFDVSDLRNAIQKVCGDGDIPVPNFTDAELSESVNEHEDIYPDGVGGTFWRFRYPTDPAA